MMTERCPRQGPPLPGPGSFLRRAPRFQITWGRLGNHLHGLISPSSAAWGPRSRCGHGLRGPWRCSSPGRPWRGAGSADVQNEEFWSCRGLPRLKGRSGGQDVWQGCSPCRQPWRAVCHTTRAKAAASADPGNQETPGARNSCHGEPQTGGRASPGVATGPLVRLSGQGSHTTCQTPDPGSGFNAAWLGLVWLV